MKTYFIGLGGGGLRTVSEIQKRLSVLPNWENDFEFTYIDTDKNTYNNINENGIVISGTDFKNMGDTNPYAVYDNILKKKHRNADEERFLEWVISQEPGHMVIENAPLNDGAKAFRNLGRIANYNKYDVIAEELETKINKFQSSQIDPQTSTRDVDIWVVASSCGGTGSSNLLDVLYMINRISNPVVLGNGVPNLKLVLFMPQPYVDKNKDNFNYPLNAYSCMWELNAFRYAYERGNKKTFEMFATHPTAIGKEVLDFPLYKFVIPVDAETNTNTKLNLDTNYYPTIAEMIYYLTYGKGAREMCSSLSNDVANMSYINEWTRSLIAYGFRAIKKPNLELKKYLEIRGAYEILTYGLLDKNKLGKVKEEKVKFANEHILSKLTTFEKTEFEEDGEGYNFEGIILDADSLKSHVTSLVDGSIKYNPNALDNNVLMLQLKKLSEINGAFELKEIKESVVKNIKKAIDKGINDAIIRFGMEFTYELLNTVDDFYLEPLNRYIRNTLITEQEAAITKNKGVCDNYLKKGIGKRNSQEVGKALKSYKESLTSYIILTITSDIIRDLTEAPNGYLEVVRKGDRTNYAGLLQLKKAVADMRDTYEAKFDELAKEFRDTKNDAMTITLPNLADIATGPDNSDWKPDNFFDELYQGSILEQEEFDGGFEKYTVPKRQTASGRGLTDYLKLLDPDVNLFTSIIKDKNINLEMNVEKKLRTQLEMIIGKQATNTQTSAGEFMGKELKEIIDNPSVLPKSIYKTVAELYNDFKDTSRVPVFFPLKAGETLPGKMRLMFVGNDENMARDLGYDSNNNNHKWVEDSTMKDRFMIMRMPIGLGFEMYKYYPDYKNTYENPTINNEVRNKKYGCHIHQLFNECNDFHEILVEKRLEVLIKCLYYQYVADQLKEKDQAAYGMLFEYVQASASSVGNFAIKIKGMENKLPTTTSSNTGSFISITPDYEKMHTELQLRPVSLNSTTRKLSIDTKNKERDMEFNETQTENLNDFVDKLLSLPLEYFSAAKLIEDLINQYDLTDRVKVVKEAAISQLRDVATEEDGTAINNFALCLYVWRQFDKPKDRRLIGQIDEIIHSL